MAKQQESAGTDAQQNNGFVITTKTTRKPGRAVDTSTVVPCGWDGFTPVVIDIAPNEKWCRLCGTVAIRGSCPNCPGASAGDLIPAVDVLRPDEYRMRR